MAKLSHGLKETKAKKVILNLSDRSPSRTTQKVCDCKCLTGRRRGGENAGGQDLQSRDVGALFFSRR